MSEEIKATIGPRKNAWGRPWAVFLMGAPVTTASNKTDAQECADKINVALRATVEAREKDISTYEESLRQANHSVMQIGIALGEAEKALREIRSLEPPHISDGTAQRIASAVLPPAPRQVVQRQDSLKDQMNDVYDEAAKMGCYDAADWISKHFRVPRQGEGEPNA